MSQNIASDTYKFIEAKEAFEANIEQSYTNQASDSDDQFSKEVRDEILFSLSGRSAHFRSPQLTQCRN